jgi:hypothetical protein
MVVGEGIWHNYDTPVAAGGTPKRSEHERDTDARAERLDQLAL